MFFRREQPKTLTFADYLSALRQAGFTVRDLSSGKAEVSRDRFVAVIEEASGEKPKTLQLGLRFGAEIGELTHGGYQMFYMTPSGKKAPALAQDLREQHDFREDLVEALGEESYYNVSLGSICAHHLYDRVKDRDTGGPERVWE